MIHRLCLRFVLLALVAGQPACGGGTPHAEFSGNEIDLNAEEPDQPPPKLPEICKKGEAGVGCGVEATPTEDNAPLDPEQRYEVELSPLDPVKGPALAPITLVVFSDFQCPFCGRLAATLAELQMKYPSELRIVWKDLPLPMHEFALPAALLGRQAYKQGGSRTFWQLHDALFIQQARFSDETLQRIAERFELTWPPDESLMGHIDSTFEQVEALNVRSTPTTFINGWPIVGVQPTDSYVALIERELSLAAPAAPSP